MTDEVGKRIGHGSLVEVPDEVPDNVRVQHVAQALPASLGWGERS